MTGAGAAQAQVCASTTAVMERREREACRLESHSVVDGWVD
jgi:hypothetical protein